MHHKPVSVVWQALAMQVLQRGSTSTRQYHKLAETSTMLRLSKQKATSLAAPCHCRCAMLKALWYPVCAAQLLLYRAQEKQHLAIFAAASQQTTLLTSHVFAMWCDAIIVSAYIYPGYLSKWVRMSRQLPLVRINVLAIYWMPLQKLARISSQLGSKEIGDGKVALN